MGVWWLHFTLRCANGVIIQGVTGPLGDRVTVDSPKGVMYDKMARSFLRAVVGRLGICDTEKRRYSLINWNEIAERD